MIVGTPKRFANIAITVLSASELVLATSASLSSINAFLQELRMGPVTLQDEHVELLAEVFAERLVAVDEHDLM